jgi:hypothetical protein
MEKWSPSTMPISQLPICTTCGLEAAVSRYAAPTAVLDTELQ